MNERERERERGRGEEGERERKRERERECVWLGRNMSEFKRMLVSVSQRGREREKKREREGERERERNQLFGRQRTLGDGLSKILPHKVQFNSAGEAGLCCCSSLHCYRWVQQSLPETHSPAARTDGRNKVSNPPSFFFMSSLATKLRRSPLTVPSHMVFLGSHKTRNTVCSRWRHSQSSAEAAVHMSR